MSTSTTNPVRNAVIAAGVEPYLGYAFAGAFVRHLNLPDGVMAQEEEDAADAVSSTFNAVIEAHGRDAAHHLNQRLFVAWQDKAIRQSPMG